MVNKAKMKRVMPKQFTPTRANLAQVGGTPLELPNHSRGKAPEADRGLVNKEYVDDQNLWKVNGTGCTELKTPDGVNLQDNFLYFDTAKKVGLVGIGGDLGVGLEPGKVLKMNTNKITGVVDPTADQDASTKKYVDDKEVESFPTSLTSGSVLFSDGTSVTQDNANLYWDNTNKRLGIGGTPSDKLHVAGNINSEGRISSDTLTVTASADNTNVSGVNTIWITTTAGDVVLGGLTGGVDGQVLYIIRKDTTNDLTLEDSEGAGDQDFIMHQGADEIIDGGGVVLVCDGSDWYDCSHAKHV